MVAVPVWLLLTQKGPVGGNATPQGLIRFGSCIDALRCPVWSSDTRLDWLNSRPLEAIASCAAGGASRLDVVVVDTGALVVVVPMLGFSAPKLAIACPSC